MGLFDSLLNAGKKAISDVATDKLSEAVNDKLGGVMDGLSSITQGLDTDTFGKEAASYTSGSRSKDSNQRNDSQKTVTPAAGKREEYPEDDRPFDVKFREAVAQLGGLEITTDINPDVLEQEYGQTIYTRSGCYCLPDKIAYKLTKDGDKVVYIRLWYSYDDYNHAANRQIKKFCDRNGVRMLDFFDYMPNAVDYMVKRIGEQL